MNDNPKNLKQLFQFTKLIREWFTNNQFLDVITPPLVHCPGIEPHIHPFKVTNANPKSQLREDYYLHTSPEFFMKRLLSLEFDKIFSLNYVFRDEANSPIHRPQFLMLEWYRRNHLYSQIMQDCQDLIHFLIQKSPKDITPIIPYDCQMKILSMREVFYKFLSVDLYDLLNEDKIISYIQKNHSDIPLPIQKVAWEDYFFLLFLNKIETQLNEIPLLIIKEFPYQLSALSRIKPSDKNVCERFELYINGIEVANAYQELNDIDEQRSRAANQINEKFNLYNYKVPSPNLLFNAIEKGIGESAGIALGVERLLMCLWGTSNPFLT